MQQNDILLVKHMPLCFDDEFVIQYGHIQNFVVVITFPNTFDKRYNV